MHTIKNTEHFPSLHINSSYRHRRLRMASKAKTAFLFLSPACFEATCFSVDSHLKAEQYQVIQRSVRGTYQTQMFLHLFNSPDSKDIKNTKNNYFPLIEFQNYN